MGKQKQFGDVMRAAPGTKADAEALAELLREETGQRVFYVADALRVAVRDALASARKRAERRKAKA